MAKYLILETFMGSQDAEGVVSEEFAEGTVREITDNLAAVMLKMGKIAPIPAED